MRIALSGVRRSDGIKKLSIVFGAQLLLAV
jgi:hypothetical protein